MKEKIFKITIFSLLFLTIITIISHLIGIDYVNFSYVYTGLIVSAVLILIIFNKNITELIEDFSIKYKGFFEIMQQSFNYLLIIYLILLLLQEFRIFRNLNSNILLIAVIVTGIFSALAKEKKIVEKNPTKWDYTLIWILGVLGCVLIFIKTKDLGWLSYVISVIAGALIVLVGYLIYEEDEEEEEFNFEINKKTILISLGALLGLSIILSIFIGLSSFRIVFGSVYVLFLPGFILSYNFFDKKEIDALERIALSFGLSIAVVPLLVFYLNLIGMKINTLNVSLTIAVICAISGLILWKKEDLKKLFKRKK
jgi:hypothetical protein